MSRSTTLSQQIRTHSHGIFSTLTDAILAAIYCLSEYATTPRSQWSRVNYQVMLHLEQCSSATLKRTFSHLLNHDYLSAPQSGSTLPVITAAGVEKLRLLTPTYRHHRPWDGKFYLISYDLPRTRNADRNHLRNMIKLLGCVRIQHSTWLTPYHPQNFLPQNLDSKNLNQVIAISYLDTSVGIGTTIPKHIPQLYQLEKLNQDYAGFIATTNAATNPFDTALGYWQVLRDDPQLPFELLPQNWLGDKAYQLFRTKTGLT